MTLKHGLKEVFHHFMNVVFSPSVQQRRDEGISPVTMRIRQSRLILALLFLCQSQLAMSADSASLTVDTLHNSLIEAMKMDDAAGFQSRYSILEPVILAEFDFDSIARIVIGREWKTLVAEKQQDFLNKFSALSIATYASRFTGYSGESFVIDEVDEKKPGQSIVRTRLIKSDGDSVSLDYMVQANDGDWRILNVIAQGISDLSLKRSEYRSIIKNDGFDALLLALDQKLELYNNKQ